MPEAHPDHEGGVICQYCNRPAYLVGGDAIYPRAPRLHNLKFWQCVGCDAYVGCHPGTEVAKGTLADAGLRYARKEAHACFDTLWKGESKVMNRESAYRWLANKFRRRRAHIGWMTEDECEQVAEFVSEYWSEQ
jgi:hypothetical protein